MALYHTGHARRSGWLDMEAIMQVWAKVELQMILPAILACTFLGRTPYFPWGGLAVSLPVVCKWYWPLFRPSSGYAFKLTEAQFLRIWGFTPIDNHWIWVVLLVSLITLQLVSCGLDSDVHPASGGAISICLPGRILFTWGCHSWDTLLKVKNETGVVNKSVWALFRERKEPVLQAQGFKKRLWWHGVSMPG